MLDRACRAVMWAPRGTVRSAGGEPRARGGGAAKEEPSQQARPHAAVLGAPGLGAAGAGGPRARRGGDQSWRQGSGSSSSSGTDRR